MKNLVKKYLHQNQFNDVVEDFEDFFQSHPNYPSLYAVTDTFSLLSIENVAIKIPKEQIEELPKEFLAIYDNYLVLVNKSSTKISIENEELKKKQLSYSDFLESWNGIIIVIEPNTKTTTISNKKSSLLWLLYTLPFIALISLSTYYNQYTFNAFGSLLISLTGIIVSIFILQEKFGVKNEITSKFCNINPNTSCNSVIKSENSKINNYFNFTDLPLLYFLISFLSILIQPSQSSLIIGLVSVLSIPLLLYSLWLQKFGIKKWCVLCLAVSFLLVLQSVFLVFINTSFDVISQINFAVLLFVSIVVASIWLFIKPVLETKYNLENTNTELNKFKRNFNLFQFLSKDIEEYDDFEKLKGIEFGNENAPTQLTLVLSPSCGHCHTAFNDAYELFQKFSEKTYLNILFNINPENKDNPYKTIVENLLALNEQNPQNAQQAIIDWHINKLDLENWKRKWTVETPHIIVNQQIQNQYYWCLKNGFNYTPVKIINGNQFPDSYEINELKYFINNFNEVTEYEKSLKAV